MIDDDVLFRRALVVEDNRALGRTLSALLGPLCASISLAPSVAEARHELGNDPPDLVLTDVRLPDGTGFDVVECANALVPMPIVIALSGEATPDESFALASLGVRAYLAKPVRAETLEATLRRAHSEAPRLLPHVRSAVGRVSLRAVEDDVRRSMVQEALARTKGNRRGAAKLLSVSRQMLQHMLREL